MGRDTVASVEATIRIKLYAYHNVVGQPSKPYVYVSEVTNVT